jgi:WD40 repeat protein
MGEEVDHGCPLQTHTNGVYVVAFSPCGHFFATGGKDRAVIMWNAQTGKAEHAMQGHTRPVAVLAISAGGGTVASGSFDGAILLWDAKTGTLLRTIDAHPNPRPEQVQDLHLSSTNSSRLVSVGSSVKQWDVNSGQLYKTFAGRYFCQFSPDGRTIATARTPGLRYVLLLDAGSGEQRLRLKGHQSCVNNISWSPDGSKLASRSDENTCKLWDSSTGALLRTIQLETPCLCLALGRDWVQDTQRAMAFAMGHHPRLGGGSRAAHQTRSHPAASRVLDLEVGVVRMIVDLA